MVLYENNVHYDILRKSWEGMGYQVITVFTDSKCFGLPQEHKRLCVVAYNMRDPRTVTFQARVWVRVKKTFMSLFVVTHRAPECAPHYLLPDDSKEVLAELATSQDHANKRKKEGYTLTEPMRLCAQANIEWGQFVRPQALVESAWFKTLTIRQVDALLFSLTKDTQEHYFRDVQPSLDRTRVSSRDCDGKVIASTVLPLQMLMVFDKSDRIDWFGGASLYGSRGFPSTSYMILRSEGA